MSSYFDFSHGVRLGVMAAGLLVVVACGRSETSRSPDKPHFVTTIAPFEMVLSPVVRGRGTVEYLLAPAASPHTYDPVPSDVRSVANAKALLYGAEALDGWAARLPAQRTVQLVDLLPPDARLSFSSGSGHKASTIDPHFWTDPVAVAGLLPALADTLCAIDTGGCPTYRANADSFATALSAMDARLAGITEPIRNTPVLLAQPFFRYFLNRYGPRLVGIVQSSPGKEPTPRGLQRTVHRAKETDARFILTQRQGSRRVAEAVAEPARLSLIELDPIGGTSGRNTYESLLLANAHILRDSLMESAE